MTWSEVFWLFLTPLIFCVLAASFFTDARHKPGVHGELLLAAALYSVGLAAVGFARIALEVLA